jgi:hypothetical protein
LGMAYNTARTRLDEIVDALGGAPEDERPSRSDILAQVASGDLSVEEATRLIRGN